MRLSSLKDDPGYQAWEMNRHRIPKVFVDGVEHLKVDTADEEQGFIIEAVLTADGRVQADPKKPDEFWRRRIEGKVTIEFGAP